MKKRVNITLEDEVIQRVDRFAEQHYMSRSGAITMLIVEGTKPLGTVNEPDGFSKESYRNR
jgi:metal-responsive CopG/Arc/MetJ family transcriptional regulator